MIKSLKQRLLRTAPAHVRVLGGAEAELE